MTCSVKGCSPYCDRALTSSGRRRSAGGPARPFGHRGADHVDVRHLVERCVDPDRLGVVGRRLERSPRARHQGRRDARPAGRRSPGWRRCRRTRRRARGGGPWPPAPRSPGCPPRSSPGARGRSAATAGRRPARRRTPGARAAPRSPASARMPAGPAPAARGRRPRVRAARAAAGARAGPCGGSASSGSSRRGPATPGRVSRRHQPPPRRRAPAAPCGRRHTRPAVPRRAGRARSAARHRTSRSRSSSATTATPSPADEQHPGVADHLPDRPCVTRDHRHAEVKGLQQRDAEALVLGETDEGAGVARSGATGRPRSARSQMRPRRGPARRPGGAATPRTRPRAACPPGPGGRRARDHATGRRRG